MVKADELERFERQALRGAVAGLHFQFFDLPSYSKVEMRDTFLGKKLEIKAKRR